MKPSAIRLAGGAANSPLWVQMFADVTGLPVEIVKVKELGALGCAMTAAVAAGLYSDCKDAAKHMVTIGDRVEPNMENHKIYQKNMSFTARCLMRCLPFGAISLRNNRTRPSRSLILERKLRCVSAAAFKKQLSSNQNHQPGRDHTAAS